MGSAKLLLPWQGRTLIEHLLDAWRQSRVTRTVVVARADDERLVDKLRRLDVDLVLPTHPLPQMKDSVQAALVHIDTHLQPQPHDAWLLAPADMPRLSPRVIEQLLLAYAATPVPALVPSQDGLRGHPVLFSWSQSSAVFGLPADQGVNSLLQRLPVTEIDCGEPESWDDIDRPQDYFRLQAATARPPTDSAPSKKADDDDGSHRPLSGDVVGG